MLDNELENYILEFVTLNKSITRKIVEEKFSLKQTKAGLILKQMEDKQLLRKIGMGKNTRYYKIEI